MFKKIKFKKLEAGKVGGKKRVHPGWHDSNPSNHLEQKKRFLISKDVIIVPNSERNFFFEKWRLFEKNVIFYPFFHSFEFFLNSKKQNFEINLAGAIESYIGKVHAKFQVNRFIRTWDIRLTVLKKVVSRKKRLKILLLMH